jgi:hypothetical protein
LIDGTLANIGQKRGACKVLVRKHEVEGLFRRHTYKWEHDVEIDLKEIRWECVD